MKILLCCVAGVTSTLFASKLKDAASRKTRDCNVWSASEHAVEYSADLADVILIEPQLRSAYEKIAAAYPDKIVKVINEEDFVNFNAIKIFNDIWEEYNK